MMMCALSGWHAGYSQVVLVGEALVKGLKSGDKVIITPGIFATIVAVEEDAFHVRVDEKTKIKVLKTAVAGLQAAAPEMEKK